MGVRSPNSNYEIGITMTTGLSLLRSHLSPITHNLGTVGQSETEGGPREWGRGET